MQYEQRTIATIQILQCAQMSIAVFISIAILIPQYWPTPACSIAVLPPLSCSHRNQVGRDDKQHDKRSSRVSQALLLPPFCLCSARVACLELSFCFRSACHCGLLACCLSSRPLVMLLVISSSPSASALLVIATSCHVACHRGLILHRPLVMAVGQGHD